MVAMTMTMTIWMRPVKIWAAIFPLVVENRIPASDGVRNYSDAQSFNTNTFNAEAPSGA
jgi:hypothetical protein